MSEVIFNGAAGRIEGRLHQGPRPNSPIALILSPHPKQGGTMNNRIVHTLFKTFAYRDFTVLKFNYRGVGNSEGDYDGGEGELSDAASALDWLQSLQSTTEKFWVAGYSYGALLAMQLLMRRPELDGFVAISPPANHYDFNFLAPCPVSGQIIQGDNDTFVKPAAVEMLVNKLRAQRGIAIDYKVLKGANHLYTGKGDDLTNLITPYLIQRTEQLEKIAS